MKIQALCPNPACPHSRKPFEVEFKDEHRSKGGKSRAAQITPELRRQYAAKGLQTKRKNARNQASPKEEARD